MMQSLTPEKMISLLGEFPDEPPMNMEVLETQEHISHTRKLIEYTTEGEERVQAYLLVPHIEDEKLPGVLAIHQMGHTALTNLERVNRRVLLATPIFNMGSSSA